ncbi:MAG: hypothetical protein ACYDIC_19080 [Desulfobaccales bacterium]
MKDTKFLIELLNGISIIRIVIVLIFILLVFIILAKYFPKLKIWKLSLSKNINAIDFGEMHNTMEYIKRGVYRLGANYKLTQSDHLIVLAELIRQNKIPEWYLDTYSDINYEYMLSLNKSQIDLKLRKNFIKKGLLFGNKIIDICDKLEKEPESN